MKKILALALALMMLLSLSVVIFAADATTPTVYLSDNGDDTKSGKDAANAVKTFEKAAEILGDKGGVIMIPDVYTYPSTGSYYTKYTQGASYIIRGEKADGTSKFVHGRKNLCLNNPFTFDNLTYELTTTWCAVWANFNRLEFTETVKMDPYKDTDARDNYLFVYGGSDSKAGKAGQDTNLVLNGGTFAYIVGGVKKQEMYGNVNVTVGGKAKIFNRIYLACDGFPGDVYGTITLNINGGVIGDYIYCGGSGADSFCSGNVVINVKGGEFKGIYGRGSSNTLTPAKLTIDFSGFEGGTAEAYAAKLFDMPANAEVKYYEKPAETTTEAATTTKPVETTTEAATTTKPAETTTEAATTTKPVETTTKAAETTKANTTKANTTAAATTAAEESGCGASITVASVAVATLGVIGAGVLLRKKED